MRHHQRVLIAAVSLAGLAMAACSSGSGTGSATGGTSAGSKSQAVSYNTQALANILAPVVNEPTSVGVTTPLSKAAPKGIKVVGLDDGIVDENLYYGGMAAAAKALGWSFSTQSIDDSNPQTVISGATSAINAGAKAVVMVSELQATINKILPIANAHHAVVLDTISSNAAHPGQILGSTETHEFATQGQYVIAAILKQAAATGQVAHIGETFIPQFATGLLPEENGAKQVLAKYCPKCTMDRINVSYEDVTSGAYVQDIASYLQTHPNINFLFATNAFFVTGLVPALQQAGIKVPFIVGTEPTAVNFSALKQGLNQEWFYVPQTVLGWVWTDELARYFTGGNYNIWNTTAYDPQWLMNKTNVASVADVNSLDPPTGYQAQFEKLWHIGS
jgi:ribose transport system substrate-binding protein